MPDDGPTQRDQDAIVAAREIELFRGGFVQLDLRLERLRRPVFDQVREIIDELRQTKVSERSTRAQDQESEDAFERLRASGYM